MPGTDISEVLALGSNPYPEELSEEYLLLRMLQKLFAHRRVF